MIESMRLENGILQNAAFHNQRIERTLRLFFNKILSPEIYDVNLLLRKEGIPPEFCNTKVKTRLLYDYIDDKFLYRVQYLIYKNREVKSLKLVTGNPDYSFKYTDRQELNTFMEKRGYCDDIIIIKNGLLTDSSAANIVLNKKGLWFTPASPLLMGTQRARLLLEKKIIEADISVDDLACYTGVKLINAMLPFEDQPLIPISSIEGF